MIFSVDMVRLIHEGRKTQTRRPAHGECRYKPGRVYAVQPGRGKPATAHITIRDVRLERLGDITLRDAKREGFRTRDLFRDKWIELHGTYDPDLLVHVITFDCGDTTDRPRLLAARIGGVGGDYTTIAALSARGAGEEVSEDYQTKFALDGRIRQLDPLEKDRTRLRNAVATIRLQATLHGMGSPAARKRLKRIEHDLRQLDLEARRSA